MKTQYYTASSLDGFIADERNSLDWLFQFGEGPGGNYDEFIARVGAIAMGSTTYEWILEHLVNKDPARPAPWPYAQPSWVFTTRDLPVPPGADVRFVRGEIPPVHAAMAAAAKGKNLWVVGGGELVGRFHDHGLLDEILVTFASVTLGRGAPLLPRRIVTPPMRLVSAEAWGDGFAHLVYEVRMGGGR